MVELYDLCKLVPTHLREILTFKRSEEPYTYLMSIGGDDPVLSLTFTGPVPARAREEIYGVVRILKLDLSEVAELGDGDVLWTSAIRYRLRHG